MIEEDPMGIEIRGMAPLVQVFDMPTSIKFYRDVLGFEVVTTSTPRGEQFDWALLRLSGVELMLNTAYEEDARPGVPDAGRWRRTTIRACTLGARMWMRRMRICGGGGLRRRSLRWRLMG